MEAHADNVREALILQWQRIAAAVPALDLEVESRISGWRNREVLAHLAVQPTLLGRFLETASADPPRVSLAANLVGTVFLSDRIDTAARGAGELDLDFAARVTRLLPALAAADLNDTVTTLQGPIALVDYLRTRCIEAVVHGGDFVDPVTADEGALLVASGALLDALAARRPELVPAARSLSPLVWVDQATGRARPSPPLDGALPVMA
ncbi:MAG TPA: maleylpyruvate isomerase N-terminal domain-containing protein [Acidimicrobiales bacterium]|nr:maleylpyruvate isomerase N-terminal domain-containing protein [Acidimicrobiales bacterium]